jgi:hypothetical protein
MYGRVAYSHKTHEKMADAYVSRYRLIKIVEIILAALTLGSLLLAIFGESRAGTIVGAVLSTVILGLTLYSKEGSLGEQAQKHANTAVKLWGVREALLSLLTDMHDGRSTVEIRQERDRINLELEDIYKASPRTDGTAYARAQKALKLGQELYFSEVELDALLPEKLRRKKG